MERPFVAKLRDDLEPVARHAIGMIATIVSIAAFRMMLGWTLGPQAMLFGHVPIEYVAHLGDILAFARFFWKLVREF